MPVWSLKSLGPAAWIFRASPFPPFYQAFCERRRFERFCRLAAGPRRYGSLPAGLEAGGPIPLYSNVYHHLASGLRPLAESLQQVLR